MNKNQKQNPQDVAKGCVIMIVIVIVIFLSLKSCLFSSEESSQPEVFKPTKSLALIMSRDFVKQRLKSPSSAEFGSNIDGVVQMDEYTFMVSSFVDSQNSFGAMLRSNYKAVIKFDKQGNATCDEVVLLE